MWPGGTLNVDWPDFTTITGFVRASRRATRVNLRGFPTLSRYSPTASVAGSSSQYCMTSLPDRSARLPDDTKLETPSRRRRAVSRTAIPSAPDWLNRPRRPAGGIDGASEAFNRTSGSVLTMPKELGPTTRMPRACARRTRSRWRARPSSPVSANPLLTTTSPRTPARPQSSTTSATASAGTATTARSTSPGMSVTRVWLSTPCTSHASGFTAYRGPVKPLPSRSSSNRCPIESGSRLAPTTATARGCSSACTLRASARCSRDSRTRRDSSLGPMSNSSAMTPSS